jgi:hypothetical protein
MSWYIVHGFNLDDRSDRDVVVYSKDGADVFDLAKTIAGDGYEFVSCALILTTGRRP